MNPAGTTPEQRLGSGDDQFILIGALFLRLLGVIYLSGFISIISIGVQIEGPVGSGVSCPFTNICNGSAPSRTSAAG